MGHAQHLPFGAQGAQETADDLGHGPADTHVHLVEDEGGDGGTLGGGDLDAKADARQFAAGGDLGQGLQGLARIGADQELDPIQALDAGAEDIRDEDEDNFEIVMDPDDFDAVKTALEKASIKISDSEVTMLPKNYISIAGKEAESMIKLMDALEDNDDVQKVYTNADIAEDAVGS